MLIQADALALPTPYYSHAGITIFCADCRDILPHVTADVVVTDPPYGICHGSQPFQGGKVRPRNGKYADPVNDWHPESKWDVAIDGTGTLMLGAFPVVAYFGQWRKREEVAALMPFPLRAEIVWAKDTHVGPPCPLASRDERIWIFAASGVTGRTFETSVWDEKIIPTWEYKHHKNQKPVALMRRLLAWLPDGVAIDPYMGSGTTLVAAKQLGRKAIGIEIEERYVEIAIKRLQQEVLPLEPEAPIPTQQTFL